jgi:ubiquinone/menaquinone biosynthesis C-methylase UbiE
MEREIFDDLANRYDSWFETPLGKKIFESERSCIEKLIKKVENKFAVDLGIGTGLFTKILREKGYKVIGIDISDEMLKIAKNRGFEVIKHDLNNPLPFNDESFDFVFSMTSIEFLKNPENLVEEVYRILKKDGEFLLITLNSLSLWAFVRRVKGLFIKNYVFKKGRFYSPNRLRKFFDEKWEIEKFGTCTFIPPWNPIFPSFWERVFSLIFPFSGAISYILTKKP